MTVHELIVKLEQVVNQNQRVVISIEDELDIEGATKSVDRVREDNGMVVIG